MSARVLVVDDIFPNLKRLETKLTAEYFDVVGAMNGPDALAMCEQGLCDIVLLDVMMPGMDGFEVCRRIKGSPATAHLPVIMVTALDQPGDRLRGLDAGADDFLTKPVDDIALVARVRNLVRLKSMMDELRTRAMASRDFGFTDPLVAAAAETGLNASVLLVDERPSSHERLSATLRHSHVVDVEQDPHNALVRAAEGDFDVVIVSLDLQDFDGLRLCSQLRSLDRTRKASVLMIADPDDKARILRGLDIGVHDYVLRPVDRNELVARVRTLVRRKRFAARLRESVQTSMELAVTDALTGLHNRRYLDSHLGGLFDEAALRGRPMSILVRGIDVVARFGGEEIVVVVPDTPLDGAEAVAERIRERVEATPFAVHRATRQVSVTVSIGVAAREDGDTSSAEVLKRADQALYLAKQGGRNRVV